MGPRLRFGARRPEPGWKPEKGKSRKYSPREKLGFSHQVQRVGTDKVEELGVFTPTCRVPSLGPILDQAQERVRNTTQSQPPKGLTF